MHCIVGGDKEADFNSERAEKLKRIEIIKCNYDCKSYRVRKFLFKNKRNRVEIVCKKNKYCVVIENRGSFYYLITAFPLYRQNANKK